MTETIATPDAPPTSPGTAQPDTRVTEHGWRRVSEGGGARASEAEPSTRPAAE